MLLRGKFINYMNRGFSAIPGVEARLKVKYRIKDYENGKLSGRRLVDKLSEGFTPFKVNKL